MTEWFEQWFGEEYLRLYPHRDDDDAARMVALLEATLPLADRRVLDLACGPGRHAGRLAARGARVTGFDLSMPLLTRARRRLGADAALVRGDMRRLPFRPAAFDLIVNLFTSFGYFADDDQHRRVLVDVAALIRPGGVFVLDYLNAEFVTQALTPHEEREIGGRRVGIERRITPDGRFVVKEMRVMDEGRSFRERVRLFTPEDLTSLLADAGLHLRERFGDYDGEPHTSRSPRTILVAERPQ